MIEKNIYLYGLTRMQSRIVIPQIPEGFSCLSARQDGVVTDEMIEKLVSKSWVSFINPRKLSVEELDRVVKAHRHAIHHSHAALLIFTEQFTRAQRKSGITKGYSADYGSYNWARCPFYDNLRDVFTPYWNGASRMSSRMFGDDWYLLSLKTTGKDVLEDDILSITIKHMTGYRICSTETLYIKQDRPISESVAECKGITNEMCEAGVTREEAVAYLNGLTAPIIVDDDKHDIPFLQMLYRLCGQRFDLSVLGMRALLALVLNYLGAGHEWRSELLFDFFRNHGGCNVMPRRYERSEWSESYSLLVEVVLSVFEHLETRYNIYGIDDILAFYAFYDRRSEYDEYDAYYAYDEDDEDDENDEQGT